MARRRALAAALALAELAGWAGAAERGRSHDAVALVQRSLQSGGLLRAGEPPKLTGPPPSFLQGDGAEVFIETGQYADTWVPCAIIKRNAPGWYDVRVMAGIKGRNHTDVNSIRFNYLRQVTPEDYDKSLVSFMNHTDKVGLAVQVERESRRRKKALEMYKKARDFAKEVMSKGCPGEYIITEGNVPMADHFGRGSRNLQSTIEQCAEDCDAHLGCKAFEWDPLSTICNLKKQDAPKPGFVDGRYMLCQKFVYEAPANSSSPTAASTSPALAPNVP
mmetsp:Transcript_125323/g.366079  ORF Transcript_125323/g.366079 Transcript_125323/m.366079 type:complete len:276 (-) Transcript_125323:128-955(-)